MSQKDGDPTYESLVAGIWRHSEGSLGTGSTLLKELVRYATLAFYSGRFEGARRHLERLLNVPNEITLPLIALDPRWGMLRERGLN